MWNNTTNTESICALNQIVCRNYLSACFPTALEVFMFQFQVELKFLSASSMGCCCSILNPFFPPDVPTQAFARGINCLPALNNLQLPAVRCLLCFQENTTAQCQYHWSALLSASSAPHQVQTLPDVTEPDFAPNLAGLEFDALLLLHHTLLPQIWERSHLVEQLIQHLAIYLEFNWVYKWIHVRTRATISLVQPVWEEDLLKRFEFSPNVCIFNCTFYFWSSQHSSSNIVGQFLKLCLGKFKAPSISSIPRNNDLTWPLHLMWRSWLHFWDLVAGPSQFWSLARILSRF